ncbi:MAG: twin-arginine translocase subunit TatC [Planctomycetota bacterium]|nr:twin-arginine translocase subunit TatC [Planctomycetota bacterium]
MTFSEHLIELRRRILWVILTVAICSAAGLACYKDVFAFLVAPVEALNLKLEAEGVRSPIQPQSKGLTDTFMLVFEASLLVGLLLASPMVIYQIWAFVSPGLYPREKKAVMPILTVGILFFLGGAAFAYKIVFPFALEFFVRLDLELHILPQYVMTDYVSFLLLMMVCFGAAFEVPLVVAALARLRILPPAFLLSRWRYCVVAAFVLGSVLTPGPDTISMLLMSGALLLLYALSAAAAWVFYPREEGPTAGNGR